MEAARARAAMARVEAAWERVARLAVARVRAATARVAVENQPVTRESE